MPLSAAVALNVVFMLPMNKPVIVFNFQKKLEPSKPQALIPKALIPKAYPLPHGRLHQLANLSAVVTLLGALIHRLPAVAAEVIPVVAVLII